MREYWSPFDFEGYETMINDLKYFKHEEFDSPDLPGSASGMNPEFLKIIDQIRGKCGFPLHINSGFRTKAHNEKVGGKPESAHTLGLACDILVLGSRERFKIIEAALSLGIKRIGIGTTFLHLDMDFSKDQEVVWLYPAGTGG